MTDHHDPKEHDMTDGMSKTDREALARLVNERAKVAKAGVEGRQAELLADVEEQLAKEYRLDDEAWAAEAAAAKQAIGALNARIAEAGEELGVPEEFRPEALLIWSPRGANAIKERRGELRRVAMTRAEAMARKAKVAIDADAVGRRGLLVAGSLETSAAHDFLEAMPTPAELMPPLSIAELEAGSQTALARKQDEMAAHSAVYRRLT